MTTKIKRFVLMGGAVYYACGGFEDYLESFDSKDEAVAARNKFLTEKGDYHWAHVVDIETGEYWSVGQAEATVARFLK